MLAVASSKSLHLTLRSTGNFEQELVQSGLSSYTGTDQDLSELPSYVNLGLPASPIQVDTLAFSAPALLARFLAKSTLSANSITRLIICPDGNRSLSMNARFLESFHLPNLRHCQMDHVRIVPTASFHKFLSRHTKLQSLLLERMYLPALEQDWPTKEPKISAAILPALTTLAADTATALWFLYDRQALPHLQRLVITAGSMQSRSVGTQDQLKPLWNSIAFRNPTDLSSLALRDAFIVSRFVGVRGLSGLPEHPLRTITALILDSGGVEWMRNAQDADVHGLQAQILGALPAWVSRLFPALESLDLSKLDLTVSALVEGEFLAKMGSSRPNVTIRHSIQRIG
ncbi:hypothetical protein ONZ45_g8267 [Pleurotus djamor]|nr:hypothetical protein ONZ45_g8267 [Pleurotus djamor]